VRIAPLINTLAGHLLSDVGLFNTPPHYQHYWVWFVNINSGWPDSENLIAGDPMDLREGYDTILEVDGP